MYMYPVLEALIILAILFYPLLDFLRVVVIRLKNNKSPFTADQNHIHHWLISRGLSHMLSSIIIVGTGTLLVLFALCI